MNEMKQRARNAMIGLAIGDAISWTSLFHRSYLLPAWTRRIRREMDAVSEATHVITLPMPFSLNQPAEHFNIAPSDETEWGAFSAEILLKSIGTASYKDNVIQQWISLVNSKETVRGGVSTQAAIQNFKNGLLPPQTGRENPHYFDDGAMPRSVPIGIVCSGRPEEAARLAAIDAAVSNSEDGIWAAQSMAVAIALVSSGKSITEAIQIARQYLPESSWIKRIVDETMHLVGENRSIFSMVPLLHNKIVNREYSYGNVAPETLALTFVIAQVHRDDFESAVATAAGFAKSGETLPAMVGAMVGASHTESIASEIWMNAISTLKGICIPSFAGKNYHDLTEQIANIAGQKISP